MKALLEALKCLSHFLILPFQHIVSPSSVEAVSQLKCKKCLVLSFHYLYVYTFCLRAVEVYNNWLSGFDAKVKGIRLYSVAYK